MPRSYVEYALWDVPKLTGIIIGKCAEPGKQLTSRVDAHAHAEPRDTAHGWICVKYTAKPSLGTIKDGLVTKPGWLLIHEYAHILTPLHHHDGTWRYTYRDLLIDHDIDPSSVPDYQLNLPSQFDWPSGTRVACVYNGRSDTGTVVKVARKRIMVMMDHGRNNPWYWPHDSLVKL